MGKFGAVRDQACQWALTSKGGGQLETAQRRRSRQHEGEKRRCGIADAEIKEDEFVDCILPQPLHRNPVHLPRRRAGHSREKQLLWRLTLALDAAAQGIVVLVLLL